MVGFGNVPTVVFSKSFIFKFLLHPHSSIFRCKYRHALPPGFVLKRDKKEEKKEEVSLEELLDTQRAQLTTSTPLTLELFKAWKEKKRKEQEEAQTKREIEVLTGQKKMSGREVFFYNPDLAKNDDDEAVDDKELRSEYNEKVKEEELREVERAKVTNAFITQMAAEEAEAFKKLKAEGKTEDEALAILRGEVPVETAQTTTTTTTTTTEVTTTTTTTTTTQAADGGLGVQVEADLFSADDITDDIVD